MDKVKLSAVLIAGLGLVRAAVGESTEPVASDGLWTGLQYEMRLRAGADYNRLVNSGAGGREIVQVPSNYTGSAAAPVQPSFENVSFTRLGLAVETERAIIFPASSYVNDTEGKVHYFKNGAKLLDRSIQSEELTIHLRLRQDGLAANKKITYFVPVFQNGWSESGDKGCGFKIGFQCGDTSAESMMPMLHFGKKYITHGGGTADGQTRPWVVLEKGKWYDWIFRLRADGQGATHYRFSLYGSTGLVKTFDGYASNDCLRATCTNPTMTLGTDLASACASDWSSAAVGNNYVSIFKGAVSHCRVWNRELTDDEVKALVFVADGRKWSIGVRDGKADEFATAAEEQRTFDVQTMDWWQFPKSLTKASPFVTISDVFKQTGITATGYGQWLDVQPLTNALPANAKVEVRANGRYVGTYDLAQESQRCIPLPCGKMGTDANGRIAVTLTRVGDLAEPLVFDAVSLTAGCKISDATPDGFSYTSNKRFSFDETNRTRCRAVLLNTADEGGVNYYQEFAFDMPAAVAGKADVRYDLTFGTKNPSTGDPVKVFLNGEEVTEIPAGQSDWGVVQVLLPRAKILPGYNVIRMEIVSSTTKHYQYFHAHALSFVMPESEVATTGVSEGLVYDLGFDGTTTFNRLCNAGASGRQTTSVNTGVGTVPEHIPALPVVATRDITLRYDALTNQPCVVFPANVYTNDSSAIRCCRKGLKLTDSTISGAMTVLLRFRYDGRPINQITYFIPMFQNGWSKTKKTGFWMGLSDQGPASGAYSSVYTTLRFGEKYHIFGYGASGDGKSLPLTIVTPKRWYDWIVRVRPNGDGTSSYDTRLVCAATDPIVFTHDAVAHDALRTVPDATNPTMTLGCVGTNAGDSDWRSSSIGGEADDEGGIFNGSIARCRVWNRWITDDEINAVLKQQDGTKWSLGVKDGTSDEFAASDAADVTRTYEPATMDWRRFPKGLTAAEPTVTIRDSFVGSHVNYVRNFHYLSIEPVLTSLPANAKVLVTVNSREIATVDLADEAQRTVLLPASAMRKDGNGKTSVTIRRVGEDLSGTLSFDALSLVGGGQVGEVYESGISDGYGNNYHNRQFAFGDMSSSHGMETTGSSVWGADNDKLDFSVQVPLRLVGTGVLRYETRIKPQYGQLGQEPFKVLFNGTEVQDYPTGCANGTKIVLDLPANLVRPGLNTVRLLNCVTLEDLPAGSTLQNAYISYDYHKLQFVAEDVKPGCVLLFR